MAFQATPGTDPAIVPRPTSGGGTRGLGESFQPDLNTGTGNYQIPLWFPRGPNQFAPKIALTYSTGFGNGEFGLGVELAELINVLHAERRFWRADLSRWRGQVLPP